MTGVDISAGDSFPSIKLPMDCLKAEYCFTNVCNLALDIRNQ